MAEIKEEIQKLETALDKKLQKMEEEVKNTGKLAEDTKSEIKSLCDKLDEKQKQLDAIEAKMNRRAGADALRQKGFTESLEEKMRAEAVINKLVARKKGEEGMINVNMELNCKAVGVMSSSGSLSGQVVTPDVRPGIIDYPRRMTHVREVLAQGTTTSGVVWYMQENGPGEGAPAATAESGVKPLIDFDLEQKLAPVKKIAARVVVPSEMLDDIPYLLSFISNKGINRLKIVEDAQLLYGDGTGANLTGLTTVASAFSAGGLTVGSPQFYDVIRIAMNQIRVNEYMASGIILSPTDVTKMELTKDGEGRYLVMNVMENGVSRVWRIPVVESTAMTADKFLLGDFNNGAELLDRQSVNVRIFDQDADTAQKNQLTIIIEERLALPIYRPAAFVYGDFSDSVTAITPP